jgi:hypothetical protein
VLLAKVYKTSSLRSPHCSTILIKLGLTSELFVKKSFFYKKKLINFNFKFEKNLLPRNQSYLWLVPRFSGVAWVQFPVPKWVPASGPVWLQLLVTRPHVHVLAGFKLWVDSSSISGELDPQVQPELDCEASLVSRTIKLNQNIVTVRLCIPELDHTTNLYCTENWTGLWMVQVSFYHH